MVNCVIRGHELSFYLLQTQEKLTLMVCRLNMPFPAYPVVSILANGTLMRHTGLPLGWGFRLTLDRKIKEIP